MSSTTTYAQLMRILNDGDWHSVDELTTVSHYPQHWVDELRREGHHVTTDALGRPLVRLREREPASAVR